MQTRDQHYAQDAFGRVQAIKEQPFARSYGSMAHKLPILIHVSGLAQALAFVESRGKKEGPRQLLEDLSQTVLQDSTSCLLEKSRGKTQENNLHEYIFLTEQVLAALLWYKRYAQSILNVEQGEDDENDGENKQ